MYLRFQTENHAITAITQIDKNMGYPHENSKTWAKPEVCDDGYCTFPKPTSDKSKKPNVNPMDKVKDYTEEEYSESWFASKQPPEEPAPTSEDKEKARIRLEVIAEREAQKKAEEDAEIDAEVELRYSQQILNV